MHVLYVHQNFPAQFGHIATHLATKLGWTCTFVTEASSGKSGGIERVQYKLAGGATKQNHFCSRTFENTVWHCDAVYQTLRNRPDIKPDLIVGHSGFGSTLFLPELYPKVPVINLFEYYYIPHDPESDMDFRRDLGWRIEPIKYLRSRCRNAMILLDLQNCTLGYTPTDFQRSKFPTEYSQKLRTVFDGVDRAIYHGYDETLRPPVGERRTRTIAGVEVGPDTRVVTYVSRGFESMRGFDVFMRSARLIAEQYPDVAFIIVGTDRIAYGGDDQYIGNKKSFKEWVLEQDTYDLSKFHFVGRLNPADLGKVLASGDVHIYLTVPFVLSWSMMDAMSCGAVVVGSATSPVKEMIRDGENGLLADFFSPDEIAAKAVQVLKDPNQFRPLGRAAEQMVVERYSLDAVLPRMLEMYDEAMGVRPRQVAPPPQAIPSNPAPDFTDRPVVEPVVKEMVAVNRQRAASEREASPFRG